MKKYLFSIILTIIFAMPFYVHAADIGAPSYQVDVLSSVIDVGSGSADVVAFNKVRHERAKISNISRPNDTENFTDAIIKTLRCDFCHPSIAINTLGVFGGGSIGIGKPLQFSYTIPS